MEDCSTRIIYRAESMALYENVFTDNSGTERSFYCLIVNQDAYALSYDEGFLLEKGIITLYESFHYEGIEMALVAHASFCKTDKLH